MGLIKSAAGIGSLLMDGIGDTIRVSLTADPVEEVSAGFDILKAVDIKKRLSANSVVSYLRQNQNRFDFSCRKNRKRFKRLP